MTSLRQLGMGTVATVATVANPSASKRYVRRRSSADRRALRSQYAGQHSMRRKLRRKGNAYRSPQQAEKAVKFRLRPLRRKERLPFGASVVIGNVEAHNESRDE